MFYHLLPHANNQPFVWTGLAGDGNWTNGVNWSTYMAPGTNDVARFLGSACSGAQCNATINAPISVAGVVIENDYTGIITQDTGHTITVGTDGWTQANGVFAGSDADITINGIFTLSGGDFTATSAQMLVTSGFDYTAGTFNHNNGLLRFDENNVVPGGATILGFQSPLRCELIFISGNVFTARRWGTPQPVLANFADFGTVPIRAFGNFNVVVSNSQAFYMKLMGTRSTFSIADIEEFLQGQIVELLPEVLLEVKNLDNLAQSYNELSKKLEKVLKREINEYGLSVQKIQILSALPSKEVLEAMEAKTAIRIIGSQKEYLLYKAATSLGQPNDNQGNDPLQMMMGLMLGKGLLGADYHEKEKAVAEIGTRNLCDHCGHSIQADARFCQSCGKRI